MIAAGLLAAANAPAGGAAIGEAIMATAGALVVTAAMMALVAGHRSGKVTAVAKVARIAEKVSGIPGWAALPGTFLVGLTLAWIYERSGSIFPCMLVHGCFNAISTLLVFAVAVGQPV